jgi:hypothetical protein
MFRFPMIIGTRFEVDSKSKCWAILPVFNVIESGVGRGSLGPGALPTTPPRESLPPGSEDSIDIS